MILCLIIMERKGGGHFEASAFPIFCFLVGHAVEQGSVLSRLGQSAFVVVGWSHTTVAVSLVTWEAEQEVRIVGCDIECESIWPIGLVATVNANHRLTQTHDVGHREAFAPEFDAALFPDFVLDGLSRSIGEIV